MLTHCLPIEKPDCHHYSLFYFVFISIIMAGDNCSVRILFGELLVLVLVIYLCSVSLRAFLKH